MKLSKLLAAVPDLEDPLPVGSLDPEITSIACDSRQIAAGGLFVAAPGVNVDGHAFIEQALHNGAAAVVGQKPRSTLFPKGSPVPYCSVRDSREALAWLAAAWHDFPARKLRVVGVTGTEGKTTTVRLISEVLRAAGHRVAWISTVSANIGGQELDTGLHTTTPDALDVQRYLAQMVALGSDYAVIEATSHGLAQHRVTACEFDVAVVTNVAHEHLDYHGTYEQYRAAKARLFEQTGTSFRKPGVGKVCVLNADDSSYDFLEGFCADRGYSYGIERPSDVQAFGIQFSPSGMSFHVATPEGALHVETPLIGLFNVYNILAATSVGISQGIPLPVIQQGIPAMPGVLGRMERIDLGQDFTVIIDFAHSPNALEQALQTVRRITPGKVLAVFGCAGLRDREKRPWMGRIAAGLADYVFLTAEDPRTENVNDILEQMATGCKQAGRCEGVDFWRVPDRAEAIAAAIFRAQPGDLVIVTGKGHERSMCFGTTEYPWNEHEVVKQALSARLGHEA
jgi:UDP-N-acetylmuramoyl-L-alanyl-D-glutamate--2,6-diaminopimelate ligase